MAFLITKDVESPALERLLTTRPASFSSSLTSAIPSKVVVSISVLSVSLLNVTVTVLKAVRFDTLDDTITPSSFVSSLSALLGSSFSGVTVTEGVTIAGTGSRPFPTLPVSLISVPSISY